MVFSSPGSMAGTTSDCASSLAQSPWTRTSETIRHDLCAMPMYSALDRLAERRNPLDVVEIVDPLQHHALHTSSFQLTELRRDLLSRADNLALGAKLVGALARQSLGKLVLISTENDPRHQRAAEFFRRPSLL